MDTQWNGQSLGQQPKIYSGALGSGSYMPADAAPQSDVQARLVTLAKAVEEVGVLSVQLHERLAIVMRPVAPQPAMDKPSGAVIGQPPCHLSEMVYEQSSRVLSIADNLRDLLNRLQV